MAFDPEAWAAGSFGRAASCSAGVRLLAGDHGQDIPLTFGDWQRTRDAYFGAGLGEERKDVAYTDTDPGPALGAKKMLEYMSDGVWTLRRRRDEDNPKSRAAADGMPTSTEALKEYNCSKVRASTHAA